MPIMSGKEARKLGLQYYWTGKPCIRGHHSKRRTRGNICTACGFLGSSPISTRSKKDEVARQHLQYNIHPTQKDKFLARYAETKNLELSAKAINLTPVELNVQIARSPTFAMQIYALEKRMKSGDLKKEETYTPSSLKWTPEKHALFIRAYVDTGDIAAARDSVGASASNYFDELENNPEFASMVKEAHPKASQALEEKAINLALKGNDKLLTLVLKAKLPEYKDKLQIDQVSTTFVKVSDEQLVRKVENLYTKYRDVIEGEVVNGLIKHESQGQGSSPGILGRIGSQTDSEQTSVLLSRDGTPQ